MYEQVEKPKVNKSRAVANSIAQKKSNVKQEFGFVDNRPEAKQTSQFQVIADNFSVRQRPIQKKENNAGLPVNLKNGNEKPVLKSDVKVGSKIIQKRDREAVVDWNVTHEVFPDEKSSLFGDDSNPFKNEGIELYSGERIVVDDEDIFQSRRGANQELSERRESDKEGHLTNKWLKLKAVEEREPSGKGYVREDAIKIAKGVKEERKIVSEKVDSKTAKAAGDEIYSAWVELRKKRRMSVGAWEKWEKIREEKEKDSSPSWDQIEEGYDVSNQLSNSAPEEYDNYSVEKDSSQGIFTARDPKSKTQIGIIIIEKRTGYFPRYNEDNSKKWYLRWLIGHPTLKGAGGLLLSTALEYVSEQSGTAVWVESAPSATSWYEGKGFERVSAEEQEIYNKQGLEEELEEETGFMEGWDSPLMVKNL